MKQTIEFMVRVVVTVDIPERTDIPELMLDLKTEDLIVFGPQINTFPAKIVEYETMDANKI